MKHWVVLGVLAVFAATAHATVSVAPDSIAIGSVPVGSSDFALGTLSDTGLDDVDLDFTCPDFDIPPNSNIALSAATPVAITATFTPATRGLQTCTVTLFEHVGGAN